MPFKVVKENKRLWIVCDLEKVYTPPNFLKLPDRLGLSELAAKMTKSDNDIDLIMLFESKYRKLK